MSTTASGRSAATARPEPDLRASTDGSSRSVTYRSLSPKVPVGLGASGGAAVLAGSLGVHLRATRTIAEGQPPLEVFTILGAAARPGWLLAIAGVIAGISALAWRAREPAWLLAPLISGVGTIAAVVARLRFLDERAAEMVAAEAPSADFVSFHAGFGWGAWFLLVGAILLGLSLLAGLMRAADVRQGLTS